MKYGYALLVLFLESCGEPRHMDILTQLSDVKPWIKTTNDNAVQQAEALKAYERSDLLSVDMPTHMPLVFSVATQVKTLKKTDELPFVPPEQKQEAVSQYQYETAVYKDKDLSQANATDLSYMGLITQGSKTLGMVKVGERLYPINQGDLIGLGRWRVQNLNTQMMQIQMGNKAVIYDKN